MSDLCEQICDMVREGLSPRHIARELDIPARASLVRAYFDANPGARVADIARLFGLTVNHVKRILLSC